MFLGLNSNESGSGNLVSTRYCFKIMHGVPRNHRRDGQESGLTDYFGTSFLRMFHRQMSEQNNFLGREIRKGVANYLL